jgi:CHAT domain-containing protein
MLLLQTAHEESTETNRRIAELEKQAEDTEAKLTQKVSHLGQARRSLDVTIDQVQSALPKNTVLVEYLRYWHYIILRQREPYFAAIVLSPDRPPAFVPLGKAQEIETLVRRYQTLVRRSSEDEELSANLSALYSSVWEPIEHVLPQETKRLIISPDEQLNFLGFSTLLHLATHGFFAEGPKTETKLEPQLANFAPTFTLSRFFVNPMHRSGLALAGAETTLQAWKRGDVPPIETDGIVTAEDISTIDLKGTWLVTLSACDTGSGEARVGEGVLGLRRGFIEAGAQNLLMTLWPISDQFTVQIMSDFYEAAHKSGDAPLALATVQRDWLVRLRKEKGLAQAVNLAGPFIMNSQGKP